VYYAGPFLVDLAVSPGIQNMCRYPSFRLWLVLLACPSRCCEVSALGMKVAVWQCFWPNVAADLYL